MLDYSTLFIINSHKNVSNKFRNEEDRQSWAVKVWVKLSQGIAERIKN